LPLYNAVSVTQLGEFMLLVSMDILNKIKINCEMANVLL
jgi:hypothetical protein